MPSMKMENCNQMGKIHLKQFIEKTNTKRKVKSFRFINNTNKNENI